MSKTGKKTRKELKKKSATASSPAAKSRSKREDNIAKSRKLTEKLKSCGGRTLKSSRSSNLTYNSSTKVCDNGKPMPPLSELEKMFEDSDDEEPKIITIQKEHDLPVSPSSFSSNNLTSPSTIKKIADRMMDFTSNLPDPTPDNGSSEPVVHPKKRNKNKGMEEECPNREIKRYKASKNNDVTIRLKDYEKSYHSDGSTDSNKTIDYDLSKSPSVNSRPHQFSPLPSTSRDRETINRNDQLFNESLSSETVSNENTSKANTTFKELKLNASNDKESLAVNTVNVSKIDDDVEILQSSCETIVIDEDFEISKPIRRKNIDVNNILDCIEVVEPDVKKKNFKLQNSEAIVIDDDDCYSKSVDDNSVYDEFTEVIDVDDILAENKAIIDKYSKDKNNDINTVTYVDCTTISNLDKEKNEPRSGNRENVETLQPFADLSQIVGTNNSTNSHHSSRRNNQNDSVILVQDILPQNHSNKSHQQNTNIMHDDYIHLHDDSDTSHQTHYLHRRQKKKTLYKRCKKCLHYHHTADETNNRGQDYDSDTDISHERKCNKNHEHHTSDMHRHIFKNIQLRYLNEDRNSHINNNQQQNNRTDRHPHTSSVDETNYIQQDCDSDSDIPHERICNRNHEHHTSDMHRHIFKNIRLRNLNKDRSNQINNNQKQNNRTDRHLHTSSVDETNNRQQDYDSDTDIPHERICDKNHEHHTCDMHRHIFKNIQLRNLNKDRSRHINNNQQQNNRTDKHPHTSSVQQTCPTAPPVPKSPRKKLGDCPICMDSLAKNAVASTICGHVFCLKCIDAAFKTSGKKCPTCRKSLKKGGYHQIFL
ncbi:GATA zinc finger domain-containing protein 14-like [Plodia interpunctella]|uniref:GATA zinc finger domain-containing protein 14-like n=1 Tax=Plodia interpunctella TaxID=58824 RepID=UPI0023684A63|nr:GATA zinc finger domain-containing protein 14-like [Plodia interpunctella]